MFKKQISILLVVLLVAIFRIHRLQVHRNNAFGRHCDSRRDHRSDRWWHSV